MFSSAAAPLPPLVVPPLAVVPCADVAPPVSAVAPVATVALVAVTPALVVAPSKLPLSSTTRHVPAASHEWRPFWTAQPSPGQHVAFTA